MSDADKPEKSSAMECDTCDNENATYLLVFTDGKFFRLGANCLAYAVQTVRRDSFIITGLD